MSSAVSHQCRGNKRNQVILAPHNATIRTDQSRYARWRHGLTPAAVGPLLDGLQAAIGTRSASPEAEGPVSAWVALPARTPPRHHWPRPGQTAAGIPSTFPPADAGRHKTEGNCNHIANIR